MVFSKLRASAALLAYASLASASSHMIMGGLNPIAIERVDPIVNPGGVSDLSPLYVPSISDRPFSALSVRVARSLHRGCEQPRPELQLRLSAPSQLHVCAVPAGGPERVLGCKFELPPGDFDAKLTDFQPTVHYQDQNTHQLTLMREFPRLPHTLLI